jgi:ELWxxDGT repeat protein
VPNRFLSAAVLATLLLFLGAASPAQTASLARDVAPGPPAGSEPGGGARDFVTVPGRALFFTGGIDPADPAHRLWATDGTDGGTELLQTFCLTRTCPSPPGMVAGGLGLAFFQVSGVFELYGSAQVRLWRTDGTRAGTFAVSEPFFAIGNPIAAGGRLFFSACVAYDRCRLWRTNGSPAGTARVSEDLQISGVAPFGGQVFFLTSAPEPGLWKTDGTLEGTVLVRTLPAGGSRLPTPVGSRLFFMAGPYGQELWTSDGTAEGTRLVETFSEHGDDEFPPTTTFLKPLGSGVIFVAAQPSGPADLWVSDGSRNGTRPLTRFDLSSGGVYGLQESQIAILPDRILFPVNDSVTGPRLWSTRGSLATSAPVTGCPGPDGCPELRWGTPLIVTDRRIVFSATDSRHGGELWTSDGTAAGTRLAGDLCPGACGSNPASFAIEDGRIYFAAGFDDRIELWRTDGSRPGTVPLARLATPPPPPGQPGGPVADFRLDLAALGQRVFFPGFDPVHGRQPWVTDGTPAGTERITSLETSGASSHPADLHALGGRVLFTASDGLERSVWTSAGNPADTLALPGTGMAPDQPAPADLTIAGGLGFFTLDHGAEGVELWRTDGTFPGTFVIATFHDRLVDRLMEIGGRLLFLVSSTTGEKPLHSFWTSDGTPAGTVKRLDLPEDTVGVTDFVTLGTELQFVALRETSTQLFRSDGTPAGTRALLELYAPSYLGPAAARVGHQVYFLAQAKTPLTGIALWRTDGTPEGTVSALSTEAPSYLLPTALFEFQGQLYFFSSNLEIDDTGQQMLWRGLGPAMTLITRAGAQPGYLPSPEFTVLGSELFFRAWDPEHGYELWKTDGTPAGTALVRDVVPGPDSSDPRGLTVAGGRLFFSAQEDVHGRELWTSDGTSAGTKLVVDLAPGGPSSRPEELTAADNRLFFTADDGLTGREPWSLPLDVPACQPSPARLCLSGYQVEVSRRGGTGEALPAETRPLTPNTGLFSFYGPANPEVAVKVLDGRSLNGHAWVFYGGLTNAEFTITVTDPATGAARRYVKPAGRFASLGDTHAFGPLGATGSSLSVGPLASISEPITATRQGAASGPCVAGPTRLCLQEGRFAVELQGPAPAGAVPIEGTDSGYFWLFAPDLPEVVIKVIDGQAVNGHFWVFLAGLTHVEHTVTVTDTLTGTRRTYRSLAGRFISLGDTGAF